MPEDQSTQRTESTNVGILSNEMYSLIGGAPPIAFVKPTFKSKYNKKDKVTPWVYQPFTHPARGDDLVLHHWTRQDSNSNQEYPFAKFNRIIDVPEYTDEEYERYLTDPSWTKEETDALFRLCRQFDLRFPVIEDRYNLIHMHTRSMEDLKDRYYSIQRKLIKSRPHAPGEYPQERQALLQQYAYDKTRETERKQILINLLKRSREEVELEEALFVEARRIEQNEPRLSREREALLSALQLEQAQQAPAPPPTPTSASALNTAGSAATASTSSGVNTTLSTPGGIGITGGTASTSGTEKKKKKVDDSAVKKGRRTSSASLGVLDDVIPEKKEKMIQGVYVRSQKLPVITKQALQQKLLKTLSDLDIGVRPAMPTAQVVQKFEQLHHSILYMFDLKKTVDKMEAEHRTRMQRVQMANRDGANRKQAPPGPREKRRKQG